MLREMASAISGGFFVEKRGADHEFVREKSGANHEFVREKRGPDHELTQFGSRKNAVLNTICFTKKLR